MPYIINSSPVKTGGSSYDRTIKTQADFDSFCSAIINGTMTDKRILFVGDGGTLVFTKELGGILLPSNVCEIKGVNNAKISVGEVESASNFGVAYGGTISNENNVVIDGLYVEVVSNQLSVVGIKNFFNVNNCFVYAESYGAGASSTGFYGCKNLENCSTYVGSTGVAYDSCNKIVNCIAEECETLYKDCLNVGALADASNLTEENVASWQEKLREEKYSLSEVTSSTSEATTTSSTTLVSKSIAVKANRNYLIFFSAPIHCANYGGAGLDLIIDNSTKQSVVNTSTSALNMNIFYIYKPTANATINLKLNLRAYSGDTAKLRGYQSRVLSILEV